MMKLTDPSKLVRCQPNKQDSNIYRLTTGKRSGDLSNPIPPPPPPPPSPTHKKLYSPEIFEKTVFFHHVNIISFKNIISFYKVFMVHYDYLSHSIPWKNYKMELYSYFDGKTQFSQIFLGCNFLFFFGGGGGGGVGLITVSFTCAVL